MKKKPVIVPTYKKRQQERLSVIQSSTLSQKEIEGLLRELHGLYSKEKEYKKHLTQLSAVIDLLNAQIGNLATANTVADSYRKTMTEFIEGEVTFLEAISLLPADGGWRQILRACARGETQH